MRSRVRRLVVASLVLLALGFGAALVATGVLRQRLEDELRRQALDLLPHVAQRIKDFHRVKVDQGRKVWEVSAREAQYHEEEQLVLVTEPAVSFYSQDGPGVALRGREGKVFLDGQELEAVELVGELRIQFGDYSLQTDLARYERKGQAIVAPGAIEITGKRLDLHGERLELDLSAQRLHVLGNVRMVLHPQADAVEGG
jgi:LPS export ABC transporter protein LptC